MSLSLSSLGSPPLCTLGHFTKVSQSHDLQFLLKITRRVSWHFMERDKIPHYSQGKALRESSVLLQTILVISLICLALELPVKEVMTVMAFSRNHQSDLGFSFGSSLGTEKAHGGQSCSCMAE